MSLVPKFWTQVVFLIDPPATPLSAVMSQLSWSQDAQLSVLETRRAFHDSVDRDYEKAQIISIMNLLGPHIHCVGDLRLTSCLAPPCRFPVRFPWFCNHPRLPRGKDDGGPDNSTLVALSRTEHKEFECLRLEPLIINGRNYHEACRMDGQDLSCSHPDDLPLQTTSGQIILKQRVIATTHHYKRPRSAHHRSHPSPITLTSCNPRSGWDR